ncbi:MAG: LysE family translocator [Sphingomonadales bacterium]|nr:MAG: LysE family translocator [Sphingomonadales bacterium]
MDLGGFALAVLLVELTPGPNMGWLVTLTLAEGRRASLGAIAGVALGLAANAAISVFAASLILAQGPALARGMSVLAAAMMAWLAWEAWRDAGESSPTATPRRADQRHALAGFAINLINPKSALFFITVMPQFIAGGQPSFTQGLTLAAISVSIATAIHLTLVLAAEHARRVGAWFLAKAFA